MFADAATPDTRVERAIAAGELLAATDAHDVMIGYALIAADPDEVHLEELAVEPAHGRRGHGTALLGATLAMAERTKAKRITLVTLDFVPFGKPFYERAGVREIPRDALPLHLRELLPTGEHDGRIAMARTL